MRRRVTIRGALLLLSSIAFSQAIAPFPQPSLADRETKAIQKIEDDLTKGENNTDLEVVDRVLADDCVNLNPRGRWPTNAEIL
jgi:hypothetical protein